MKKVALSLAGVLAAAAFAPEASAIPSFARQTGMACSSCHYQHFPVLNGFGRAFKAAGFTMIGSQEKVEGEHLSIPGVLNASVLLKAQYIKTDGKDPAGTVAGTTKNSGAWDIPNEYALFLGGRVADLGNLKIGYMMENPLLGGPAGIAGGLRLPIVYEMEAIKLSAIPFVTDNLGPFYGYNESSAGLNRGVRWSESRKGVSAYAYTGMGGEDGFETSGFAFVAKHDMGYINVTRFAPAFGLNTGAGAQVGSTLVHFALTPNVAGWDIVASLDSISGSSYTPATDDTATFDAATSTTTYKAGSPLTKVDTKGTGASFQAQGAVADMETSLYATYAQVAANSYYGGAKDKKAFTLGADVTVIAHTLSLGGAIRQATNKSGKSDNAITVQAIYDLAQNVALHAVYGVNRGDAYAAGDAKSQFTGMLEAAW